MTALDPADDLLAFVHASPTPWHAVRECVRRLEAHGYRRLEERDRWSLEPGARFYVVRGGSSIAAFQLGSEPPSASGVRMIGAHTDSPNLRLKPVAQRPLAYGAHQLAIEPYGGVLFHTWLDRDLGLAGRLWLRGAKGVEPVLVRIDRPFARIPSLAIHLDRLVNDEGLRLNAQNHLSPLFALPSSTEPKLAELLATEAGVEASAILGYDLCLYDVVPPARGGANGELLFCPRLDNLASCHAGLSALLAENAPAAATRCVALFDHEEIGSRTAQGADSSFLTDALARIVESSERDADAGQRAMARSFLISADMAHGLHPNYAEKHEPQHRPLLGGGPVLKSNVNQRYATDGEGWARFATWCERADVIPQQFVTRSDLACGSTIGPMSAARMGVRTIDVGNPMLSMHSCREMAAAADVGPMIQVLRAFLTSDD